MDIDDKALFKYLDNKNIFEICNHINALKPFQAA